ncbi:MAG: Patatin [Cyanobacteriota bacterium erpe_2018_sw_21hr_WHONDRS-SW48-000092_B_bin.40]|nr:Patatin [Cyanobacteriota bacterium erpe_2018_sw_21hr_WHONDRS-SW48-000092_B_bin.40]
MRRHTQSALVCLILFLGAGLAANADSAEAWGASKMSPDSDSAPPSATPLKIPVKDPVSVPSAFAKPILQRPSKTDSQDLHHGAINRTVDALSPPANISASADAVEAFRETKPRLILALSGGGCKAVAEIGVLRSFEQHGIKIDGIVGTSMGSTVGALYCAGVSVDDIEKMYLDDSMQNAMLKGAIWSVVTSPIKPLTYLFKGRPYAGITSGNGYLKLLQSKLPAKFSDLKIPFAAVVTNLTDGETTALASGDLPRSVLASNCVPTLYRPMMLNGKLYVDGGLKANLPSTIAQGMGADIVVAALVDTAIKPVANRQFKSKKNLMMRVMDIMLANADKQQAHASDILIYPDVDFVPGMTKDRDILKRGIAAGQKAADTVASRIKAELLALDRSKGVNPNQLVEIPSKQVDSEDSKASPE